VALLYEVKRGASADIDGTPHTWLMEYEKARDLQVRLVDARYRGMLGSDILLLMEHLPVFTLGRRGGRENLTVSELFVKNAGISIIHAERGGDVTFHGPGQLVGYPIIDLRAVGLTVTGYVEMLEEVMILTAAHWGVTATRNPRNHGVWVGDRKLGSLGIAIRRGIAFHGFALNVNNSLEPFDWINPCGLQGVKMTSILAEIGCRDAAKGNLSGPEGARRSPGSAGAAASSGIGVAPDVPAARQQVKLNFRKVFNVNLDMEVPSTCGMSCLGLLPFGVRDE
jgi:lipoyl(octanoyl) transferase